MLPIDSSLGATCKVRTSYDYDRHCRCLPQFSRTTCSRPSCPQEHYRAGPPQSSEETPSAGNQVWHGNLPDPVFVSPGRTGKIIRRRQHSPQEAERPRCSRQGDPGNHALYLTTWYLSPSPILISSLETLCSVPGEERPLHLECPCAEPLCTNSYGLVKCRGCRSSPPVGQSHSRPLS